MPSIITMQHSIARLEKQDEEIRRFLETSNLWRIGSGISRSVWEYFYISGRYPSVCVIRETKVTQAVADSKKCLEVLLHFLQKEVDDRIIAVKLKHYGYDTGSSRGPSVFVYFDEGRLEIEF